MGNQPEANTGKYRPWSARFISASPATFAFKSKLLLIMFYCKHQSVSCKSGWQVWGSKPGWSEDKHTQERKSPY